MNISFWPFTIYLPIWFQAGLGYDSVCRRSRIARLYAADAGDAYLAGGSGCRCATGPVLVIPAGLFTIGSGLPCWRSLAAP